MLIIVSLPSLLHLIPISSSYSNHNSLFTSFPSLSDLMSIQDFRNPRARFAESYSLLAFRFCAGVCDYFVLLPGQSAEVAGFRKRCIFTYFDTGSLLLILFMRDRETWTDPRVFSMILRYYIFHRWPVLLKVDGSCVCQIYIKSHLFNWGPAWTGYGNETCKHMEFPRRLNRRLLGDVC